MKLKMPISMSQNKTKFSSVKNIFCTVFLCLSMLAFSLSANADSFNKYVGQSFILPIPKSPISNGYVNSWSYSCPSTNINITNRGSSNPGEAVITEYFDGTLTIECYFQYIYYINNIPRSGTSTEYHIVTCNSNDISISGPKTKLNVGESMQMLYNFAHSTYDATPQITWECNSKNATVDNRGYITALSAGQATITASSNLSCNVASFNIEIAEVNPTSVSISPNPAYVACDASLKLNATVYPSGASQNVTWSIDNGSSSIASLSGNGTVTGKSPGSITVRATAENGIYATRIVNVYEPTLSLKSSKPANNADNQNVFITPSVTFSHSLYKGDNFDQISFTDVNGNSVAGTKSISGNSIVYKPERPLSAKTKYTLTIPKNSIKNKWGTQYSKDVTISFTTGELEKLTITISPNIKFVKKGASFTLASNKANAAIYYTTDGTPPSDKSSRYTSPISIQNDVTIRAVAKLEGYSDSEILSHNYIISNVAVTGYFPNNESPLYNYDNVIPSVTFSNKIKASSNINNIAFTCEGIGELQKDVIVCDSSIYILPKEQLQLGNVYKVSIPVNAITTWQGEYNESAEWSFTTGDYIKDISTGGPELSMALKSDNSLLTWGAKYLSGSVSNGSYEYDEITLPKQFMSEVKSISSGYMHHAAIKNDGSLWLWGRQYCGEFGNGKTTGSATPIKIIDANVKSVSAGGQVTGVIKADGTLWMSGRNDFGQIGNGTTNMVKSFVKVMSGVKDVSVGWGNTFAVTDDNKLYAWGRNDMGQVLGISSHRVLEPTLIMEDVKMTSISVSCSKYFTAIKTNGDLVLWESGNKEPRILDSGVAYVSVGKDYIEYIKDDGSLWSYGINTFGQLGTGNLNEAHNPTKILQGVSLVKSSIATTFAIKENGSVWSWGHNYNNLLGKDNQHSEISITPNLIIDGRPISELAGINCYKNELAIPQNSYGVVPVYPEPLIADYNFIEWSSSNPESVTVDDRGIVYGVAKGKSTISASIHDNYGKVFSVSCTVSVGDESGVERIFDNNIRLWTNGLDIHLENAPANSTVNLFGIHGSNLFATKSSGDKIVIRAPFTGVYILKIDNKAFKILCK